MTDNPASLLEKELLKREVYLGDAVYASFDGFQIWLRTGDANNQRIALEPEVLQELFKYANQVRETVKKIMEQKKHE